MANFRVIATPEMQSFSTSRSTSSPSFTSLSSVPSSHVSTAFRIASESCCPASLQNATWPSLIVLEKLLAELMHSHSTAQAYSRRLNEQNSPRFLLNTQRSPEGAQSLRLFQSFAQEGYELRQAASQGNLGLHNRVGHELLCFVSGEQLFSRQVL